MSKLTPEEKRIRDLEKVKRYQAKHRERVSEQQKRYRENNPDKVKEKQKRYLENNREKAQENRKSWTETNIEKIREQNRLNSLKNRKKINARRRERRKTDPIYKAKCDQWSKDNLDKRSFSGAKRRAAKLNATPKWLTSQDWNDIKRYYKVSQFLTKGTGIKYVVDHIHPLQGGIVCGLHVPWNLQVITDSENTSKGNRILTHFPYQFPPTQIHRLDMR